MDPAVLAGPIRAPGTSGVASSMRRTTATRRNSRVNASSSSEGQLGAPDPRRGLARSPRPPGSPPGPPRFLPDDVDGRVLFAAATARIERYGKVVTTRRSRARRRRDGRAIVRDARARGVLFDARPMFSRLTRRGRRAGTTARLSRPTRSSGAPASVPNSRHLQPLHPTRRSRASAHRRVHGNSCPG